MDRKRNEFDHVGIGSRVRVRGRQGLPGIGQVEALRDGFRKIERIQ
jgi:hypothetical protein